MKIPTTEEARAEGKKWRNVKALEQRMTETLEFGKRYNSKTTDIQRKYSDFFCLHEFVYEEAMIDFLQTKVASFRANSDRFEAQYFLPFKTY